MKSARQTIRDTLAKIAPEATQKTLREAERDLLMSLATLMVADGYTIALAADSLGMPKTTLDTWRTRHEAFAEALAEARESSRKWLLGQLTLSVTENRAWAGKAANILANLWFEELRSSKVEGTFTGVPTAGESRGFVLGAVNKSAQLDDEE